MLAWLSVWSKMQACMWPSWCHCHSLSLASVKSRLVLPFWYWLTWVVPEKGLLNGCVCVYSVSTVWCSDIKIMWYIQICKCMVCVCVWCSRRCLRISWVKWSTHCRRLSVHARERNRSLTLLCWVVEHNQKHKSLLLLPNAYSAFTYIKLFSAAQNELLFAIALPA